MQDETTTKFIGNISFNDGEKDILVSDLASVEEVNEALSECVTNDKVDTYTKMWMSTEPTQPFYLNPNFEYKDDHVMSSKAVKELIHLNSDTSSLPDMSEYRKVDDFQIDAVKKDVEIVHNEEYDSYGIKGYNPNYSITLTIFWQDKELTITTDDSLYGWNPDQTLVQELNINTLTVRHMDMWNDSDNININDCSYWVMLMDRNWDIQYPKVLSAYQTLKEADKLVLKSDLNIYALKSDIADLNISQYATNESVTTKLNDYRKLDELSYTRCEYWNISSNHHYNVTFAEPLTDVSLISDLVFNGNFQDGSMRYTFNVSIKDFTKDANNEHNYNYSYGSNAAYILCFKGEDLQFNVIRAKDSNPVVMYLNYARIEYSDELVLKSQYDELLAKITLIENQLKETSVP